VTKRNAQDFVCYDLLREYGATLAAARRYYRGYMRACVMKDDQPLLDAMQASRYAIGEESYVEKVEQRLEELRTGRIQDRDLVLPTVTVDIDTVDACVARHFAVEVADLKKHGRRAQKSRWGQSFISHQYGQILH